jgi:hypothetical protein
MGNKAVITTAPYDEKNVGIYLHWNGGRESIEGFLAAAKQLKFRSPREDDTYALARLVQIIGNFFGGTTSLGIGIVGQLDTDNGDNGVWLIGEDWKIMGGMHGADVKAKLPMTEKQMTAAAEIAAEVIECFKCIDK